MTRTLVTVAFAIVMVMSGGGAGAQTQLEMIEAARKDYQAADADLNQVYAQIRNEYRNDGLFLRKLAAAQRAWIAFRDAHVEALYPGVEPRRAYGSMYPLCRWQALSGLTRERRKQLSMWICGLDETDACGGSRKARTPAAAALPGCSD